MNGKDLPAALTPRAVARPYRLGVMYVVLTGASGIVCGMYLDRDGWIYSLVWLAITSMWASCAVTNFRTWATLRLTAAKFELAACLVDLPDLGGAAPPP